MEEELDLGKLSASVNAEFRELRETVPGKYCIKVGLTKRYTASPYAPMDSAILQVYNDTAAALGFVVMETIFDQHRPIVTIWLRKLSKGRAEAAQEAVRRSAAQGKDII